MVCDLGAEDAKACKQSQADKSCSKEGSAKYYIRSNELREAGFSLGVAVESGASLHRLQPGQTLEASASSFLARFIADRVVAGKDEYQQGAVEEELNKYSLEVIVSYLEDQGYVVSSSD